MGQSVESHSVKQFMSQESISHAVNLSVIHATFSQSGLLILIPRIDCVILTWKNRSEANFVTTFFHTCTPLQSTDLVNLSAHIQAPHSSWTQSSSNSSSRMAGLTAGRLSPAWICKSEWNLWERRDEATAMTVMMTMMMTMMIDTFMLVRTRQFPTKWAE